jgi:hypothetical protein
MLTSDVLENEKTHAAPYSLFNCVGAAIAETTPAVITA